MSSVWRKSLSTWVSRWRGRTPTVGLPPRRLRDVGDGDFTAVGEEFLGHFVQLGGLRPEARVLDLGCGCGRMALPLTNYLDPTACYVGIDVQERAVQWCSRNVTAAFPNFVFLHLDARNARYNPRGRLRAAQCVLPFPDRSFDFVLLTSVFTHLLPDDLANYASEAARVLDTRGRLFATFFLLRPDRALPAEPRDPHLDFRFDRGVYRTCDARQPERAVAYRESHVRELFSAHGLIVEEPIYYGTWDGTAAGRSLQDIVLAMPAVRRA